MSARWGVDPASAAARRGGVDSARRGSKPLIDGARCRAACSPVLALRTWRELLLHFLLIVLLPPVPLLLLMHQHLPPNTPGLPHARGEETGVKK